MLFEVTKLRIWKQLTTGEKKALYMLKLFEVTKLRIWKQLTTYLQNGYIHWCCLRSQSYEFESNSQPTGVIVCVSLCCLRSQSYEFESNSQQKHGEPSGGNVVWGHKVTNLKATHNMEIKKPYYNSVVWGHKVTNLKATHNLSSELLFAPAVVWGHKVTNLKATHNEMDFLC